MKSQLLNENTGESRNNVSQKQQQALKAVLRATNLKKLFPKSISKRTPQTVQNSPRNNGNQDEEEKRLDNFSVLSDK